MPIPLPQGQDEKEYISACIREIISEYDVEGQAYAVCKSTWDKENMSFQKITCDECGWSWDLEDGGDDPYVCHKCGKTIPKPVSEEAQQGGVVGSGSFSRTKFEYPPISKEKLNDFMSRCMSDSVVREKKKERTNRAGFCYSQYQSRYIANIGRGWR
jgi:DNA-directed RNA polymerase subunit RPC12/RpoP